MNDVQKQDTQNKSMAVKRGLEEPTQRDELELPRAKLLQALSPEVIETPDMYRPGQIINSITGEVLPAEFVPIIKFTQWIRFNPRDIKSPSFVPEIAQGAIVWRSSDPDDPRVTSESQFGPNGEKPIAIKFLCFLSLFPGVEMPVVVSFSKTSYGAGKRLMSLIRFSEGDIFSKKYQLASKHETGPSGTYFILTIARTGEPSNDEFLECEGIWQTFHAKRKEIAVHISSDDADDTKAPF